MSLSNFRKDVLELKNTVETLEKKKIEVKSEETPKVYDFEGNREDYYRKIFNNVLKKVQGSSKKLKKLILFDMANESTVREIHALISELNKKEVVQVCIDRILDLIKTLKIPKLEKITFHPDKFPKDIRNELIADVEEIEKCYNTDCYRSAVILCGRILEIALHRKYYEETGTDILEKSPGIGLGNLVLKMKERGINIDPALTQQIHLINQIRVFSVHKKQETFNPTRNQTQAIILYTCDLLEKLFS